MDNKAYHLQYLAHKAVAIALTKGQLQRQPCEVCGDAGQAHHSSYYPDRWLDVRWLCGKHHHQWHQEHVPTFPSIFEYHPSDIIDLSRINRTRKKPSMWHKKSRDCWYVTISTSAGRKQVRLGETEDEAKARYQALMDACIKIVPDSTFPID